MKDLLALFVMFIGAAIFLLGDKQTGFNTILGGFALGLLFSGVKK